MTNQSSTELKDTRGRPRKVAMNKMVERLECAYHIDALPCYFKTKANTPVLKKKEIHRFRCSFAMRDLQEELAVRFRIMPTKTGFVVTLPKEKV